MSALGTPLLLGDEATGYQISRSVRLRSSASGYFNNASTRTITTGAFTFSMWFKRGTLGTIQVPYNVADGSGNSSKFMALTFLADDSLRWYHWSGSDTDAAKSNGVLRDPAAWYHVVLSKPAGGVGTMYLNGVAQTKQTSYANDTDIFATTKFLGRQYDGVRYFDGYIAEVHAIDGQALTPSSFGETDPITGVWKPKRYAGTYGTNGFYLNFSDNSAATAAAIGKDSSGNGNNFTPNNISVTAGVTYDSMLDTPTPYADGGNGRGNYAVLNPIDKPYATATLSNANLNFTGTDGISISTIGVTSGKWYAEASWTAIGAQVASLRVYATSGIYAGYSSNGQKDINTTQTAYGATFAVNNVIGIAVDIDAGTVEFFKNGASQGSISYSMTGSTWFIATGARGTAGTNTGWLNFGQRPFAYTPPTGFKALNTQNLPDATIKKGNAYFDVSTYTGTGAAQSIVNSGAMQPDFVWAKKRNSASFSSHQLVDAVRGTSAYLFTDSTSAEVTATDRVTAFNSNGFSVSSASQVNGSSDTFVAWQWKESASAGFDIVTYTGTGGGSVRTIAHSLGVAPSMIISKCRGTAVLGTDSWVVYFKGFAVNDYIFLNSTGAKGSSANYLPALPTSSVFSVGGTSANVNNESGLGYVAYLFAEVAGFSKFGSYTGNGSADGPFVYCGFRPKFVLMKRTDTGGTDWIMWDSSRNTYNVVNAYLAANLSAAETTAYTNNLLDFVSNGFKIRQTASGMNASGGTYIFAAFAENPFKNSLAR